MLLADSMNENMRQKTKKVSTLCTSLPFPLNSYNSPLWTVVPLSNSYLALLLFQFRSESTTPIHATHAARLKVKGKG